MALLFSNFYIPSNINSYCLKILFKMNLYSIFIKFGPAISEILLFQLFPFLFISLLYILIYLNFCYLQSKNVI